MKLQAVAKISGVTGWEDREPYASIWLRVQEPNENYSGVTFRIPTAEVQRWMDLIGKKLLLSINIDVVTTKEE